ncbi:UDP-glucose--hexose-1-phosphate uridylyltransferase [Sandarakinorhabdus sp.]|uniref:UDP-glucose--hexose-1-phosphate uridylyltransferase n=1 Tax=Sandarakinorhabdus sp. TaxID=1916663 RepID=UPI0033419FEB
MTNTLPHRRQNLLTGEWVLVSPQRITRPWQGEASPPPPALAPAHDPACHLCPGNARADGTRNPDYAGVHVFPNDFPALLDQAAPPAEPPAELGLLQEMPARGAALVICYSPDHSASLASLGDAARTAVVATWCALSASLGTCWANVQIFENRGAMMGASSPHPHGQVWAGDFVPTLVAREDDRQRTHFAATGRALLADVADAELAAGTRVVAMNDDWLAVVPHWAAWPFETLIIARGDVRRLDDVGPDQQVSLAVLLGRLLAGCDALFAAPFPYSLGWHGAPHALGADCAHWRLHAHILPPLLRSASVRKHMVGFELLAETQRDLTPEAAAERLRAVMP